MSITINNRKNRRRLKALQQSIPATLLFSLAAPMPLFAQAAVAQDNAQKTVAASVKHKEKTKTPAETSGAEKTMPTVVVKTTALPNDGAVDGYKAGMSRSSTRTQTPLIDVPQSISVVTQDQIQDQGIRSMGEAIRYVPGIVVHQGESNRDQLTIRGNNTTADFFIDGARDDAQYFRDLYNIDRVEVLKGPNAMAFGRGGSGGVVNRISKTADGTRVRQAIVEGGAYDHKRIQADVGDKISDTFSFRINGMLEESGTFRQYSDVERHGFNPTATLALGENTSLQAGYEYFHDNRFNDRGIPSQNGLPYRTDPRTFFGDPTQNESDATINSGYAIFTHDFTSDLQLRNYTRYTDNSKFYQDVYAGSAVNGAGNLSIVGYNNDIERGNFTNQTDLTKKFETGSLKHTALVGMEITRQDSEAFRNTAFFNDATTSVTVPASNPITTAPITFRQSASDADNHSEVRVYAGYVQDQIDITKHLQLIGGLRFDSFDLSYHNNRNGQSFSRTDNLLSPRLGVVVKPQDNLSLYGSYGVSHLPSSGDQFSTLTIATDALKPEKLENYEIGAKWDINPSLNLTAAVYQLDRTNTSAVDPNDPTLLVPTGASRTRGVEFGATGRIADQWQIIGAYAFQDAEITKTTSTAAAGRKVALVPEHMLSVWNKYDFTPQWSAAIGAIHQTKQFAAIDNTVTLKGYTRFDGAVYYNITPDARLQLNVENLLDRNYIQTAHNNNNIQPGSPQTFRVSLLANF
jgi:catecholate siderophore receptor